MNHFEEDIKKLKTEIKKEREGYIKDQRQMKKKQEKLVLIFHQYRDVCSKAGISSSLNFTRSANQDKQIKPRMSVQIRRNKTKRKYKSKKDQEIDEMEPHKPTKENYKKLWQEIQNLKEEKIQLENQLRNEQS